jgi:hypothetical protein
MAGGICLWSVGDPLLVQPADEWHDVANIDGEICHAGMIGGSGDALLLAKSLPGWKTATANDAQGHQWSVPIVLTPDGSRNFSCPFDASFLPKPTAAQDRILKIAMSARDELLRINEESGENTMAIDAEASCRWAIELLCFANHINEKTILALGYVDETLVIDTLMKAACHAIRD